VPLDPRSQLFLVLGIFLLGLGLRTYAHPVLFRLGSLCILATSFLVGYFLTGFWWVGALCAVSWFFRPWLEIIFRVRQIRLPARSTLEYRRPPSAEILPALQVLTEQLQEEEGFEQADDAGWEWRDQQQFVRLFYKPDERLQAAICVVQQGGFGFYYVSFFSRLEDGTTFLTWNYPFAYSMKMAPEMRVNRLRGNVSLYEMLASHRALLNRAGVSPERLRPSTPDQMLADIEGDMEGQIAHNLKEGLLLPEGDGTVRYSWRGCLYIWWQVLRELLRVR